MSYRIEWVGAPKADLEALLRHDVLDFMDGDPVGLITHTMMVDDADYGSDGPSVGAHWDNDRQCLVAEYFPETVWKPLSDLKETE